ncbi:hypothetical protein [Vagococcus fluvialis]|uniref:hypothetical protein n=1 Tax=Vagococcus fluvialis TaxID=2738 RepID=UPI0028F719DC|nr:hypothetical protein [Vagococcus fluvialis]WNF91628.1 hypothetical protein QDW48_13910 [Vagococcus fluvialis]
MNDKQNELLEELKRIYVWQHSHFSDILFHLANRDFDMFDESIINIYDVLNEKEYVYVINEFSKWILQVIIKNQ